MKFDCKSTRKNATNSFCFENQIIAPMKHEVILGMNIRSLKLHLDEPNVMIKTLQKNQKNLLTETWIVENDDMGQYDLQGYQPFRSFARTECRRQSRAVVFCFENSVKNKPLKIDNKLECLLFEVQLDDFNTMNFLSTIQT